jgi:hypothetical protein
LTIHHNCNTGTTANTASSTGNNSTTSSTIDKKLILLRMGYGNTTSVGSTTNECFTTTIPHKQLQQQRLFVKNQKKS